MKRIISLLLIIIMVLSLFTGCSSEKSEELKTVVVTDTATDTETAAEELAVSVVQEETSEIQLLLEQAWIPDSIKQNLGETIRWNEMLRMMENVIRLCDETGLQQWHSIVNPIDAPMERDDGMLVIYEAACVLGIGKYAWNNWEAVNKHNSIHIEYSMGYSPRASVFTNAREFAPFENFPGLMAFWDYPTSARLFSIAQSSLANPNPYFDHVDEDTRFDDPLTRREAITATAKLIQAYDVMRSGGYVIPETNWDDPLLEDAKVAREAIINSPNTITKGDELILGETYTGKAYYVSNNGNDGNDGLTPETAWATLNKVERSNLKFGDAVFFERGGIWYGSLRMKHGVTYSAYGDGVKPMITGSPQDAAKADKWTLYAETADGGKIWQYTEKMPDSGVILLNGGEVVARKAYPLWNGKEYTNSEGKTYIVEDELADLMFFSSVNLTGVKLMDSIEGNGRTGTLYLRCDAGNPGEVFAKIEIATIFAGTNTPDMGWIAVDNLHFRCYSGTGAECNNHSNIVYQNCEIDWCGGGVKMYQPSWYKRDDIMVQVSGGGMLLFGTDLISKNNYIHDCESKGISIAVDASNGNPAWLNRFNILAEGNVVERCGTNVLMWLDSTVKDQPLIFEDIRFVGNYFVNGGYGWRQMNVRDLLDRRTGGFSAENVLATGEVLFENNLFYRGAGTLIKCYSDNPNSAVMPTMWGNTYVQDKGQLLFTKQDAKFGYYSDTTLATSDQALMEKCVREYMGDTTGKVIILE